MRLEDMKNDIPETPDFIHNMIQLNISLNTIIRQAPIF